MGQCHRRAWQAGGKEWQYPVYDPAYPEGTYDFNGVKDSRGKAEQEAERGSKYGRHVLGPVGYVVEECDDLQMGRGLWLA
jgi:hypothetical protein